MRNSLQVPSVNIGLAELALELLRSESSSLQSELAPIGELIFSSLPSLYAKHPSLSQIAVIVIDGLVDLL